MHERDKTRKDCSAVVRLSVVVGTIVSLAAAQQNPPGIPALSPGGFDGGLSFATTAGLVSKPGQASEATSEFTGTSASISQKPVRSHRIRRVTLEEIKQQRSVDPVANPLARLGQLSIDAARQHRLGLQSDYFPKFGATFLNLHFTEFLGQVISIRRPLAGSLAQIPVPLLSQNQTIGALTFVQPITPLFKVYQAVQIARADERSAMAKAGVAVTKNISDTELEEAYFKLLIAQRRLILAESKLRSMEKGPMYAAISSQSVRPPDEEPQLMEAKNALATAAAGVKEQTSVLDRMAGWPGDTELELVAPDPLVENISLEEVADKSVAGSLDVIEAEQTVIKARAASALSKLEYVPTVAAIAGYLFQNTIPLVPSNFGYGGVMVSYNLFDFGKRERAVKEARAQLGMAEIGVELTKAKIAANLKKSYFELERTRQLSQMAQKMGSTMTGLMNVSSTPQTMEIKVASAKIEVEMLEADLAHREAFAHLKALMPPPR
jgi:outer membrane protein TolC